jgi:hypothetical protein
MPYARDTSFQGREKAGQCKRHFFSSREKAGRMQEKGGNARDTSFQAGRRQGTAEARTTCKEAMLRSVDCLERTENILALDLIEERLEQTRIESTKSQLALIAP